MRERAPREPRRGGREGEAGLSLLEATIASFLSLVVAAGAYAFLVSVQRASTRHASRATRLGDARLGLERLGAAARSAGHDPVGVGVLPLVEAGPARVRLAADLDGDGAIEAGGDELPGFAFVDSGDGRVRLVRLVDLDGDGDTADPGEGEEELAAGLEPVDRDGDGALDPFLAYEPAAAPELVRVSFGVRVEGSGPDGARKSRVLPLGGLFELRNRVPETVPCPAPPTS